MPLRLKRLDFDPGWLVAALLPLIGILPTFGNGIIDTADGPLHVQRLYALSVMLGEGNLYPRWIPWFHLGFGYPIFNYYPPGVFYLSALLVRLGLTATTAFNLAAALAWVVGSLGMYKLARRFVPAHAALLAAMLWAYAPSRLFEVWDQGSLPQMMAAACVPWLFAGIIGVAHQPTRRGILGIALPLAGIIFCHQPITFITTLYTAPLALIAPLHSAWKSESPPLHPSPLRWREVREGILSRYTYVFAGLALGGCLAAIYLLPVALELRYVQASRGAADNVAYLISNFLQPGEIFAQPPLADLTDMRFELTTTLGLVGGVLSIPGMIALARRKRFALLAILVVALAFTLFMLVEPSLPVWLTIPFFRQLRFPERFLRVGAVLLALAGGASILLLPKRWQTGMLLVNLTIVLISALPLIYPNQEFKNWENLSARDEIQFELDNHTWGTTSYDEFDPVWGEKIPLPRSVPEPEEYAVNPLRIVVNRVDIARDGDIMQVEQLDTTAVRVTLTEPYAVRFHQYYYPGWAATVNGQPAAIRPDDEFGLITLDLPSGEHIVALNYVGTTAQHIGAAITLVSVGIAVLLYAGIRIYLPLAPLAWEKGSGGEGVVETASQTHPSPDERLHPRLALTISTGVVIFALVNTALIAPYTFWFRYKSPPDNPVYMQTPLHVSFGSEIELLGYSLDQRSVQPGGLLSVTLFWRAQHTLERNYRPVVQLVNLTETAAWGASEPFFPGGGPTKGYTPERFASEVHELRIFETAPPYVGRLKVQMVDIETGAPLPTDGSNRVVLDPLIRIEGSGAEVSGEIHYTLGDTVELTCADAHNEDEQYTINLYWRVLKTPAQDAVTFVHGLDASGETVAQGDAPPLGGQYPPSLWLPGQHLEDRYSLPRDSAITQVAVGLYIPGDNARLPVTQNGQPVADNRILIPVDGVSCQP